MTTLATQDFLSEIRNGLTIPAGKLSYFQARLSGQVHQALLKVFGILEKKGVSKRELSNRIGRKPEQITRWLSSPNNLTLDTVSDLFLGMGCEVQGLVVVDLVTGTEHRISAALGGRTQIERVVEVAQASSAAAAQINTGASKVVSISSWKLQRHELSLPAQELGLPAPQSGAAADQMNYRGAIGGATP